MKVEKMKESRRWLSWLPKAVLVALLGASIAIVGCKSGDDDDDPPKSNPDAEQNDDESKEDNNKPDEDDDYSYTLYSQDFEDGTTDWTSRGDSTPAKIVVKKDDAATNPNTSNYIYVIGGHSGDTSAEKAVSSSVDDTLVEFDLKFDGTATNGTLDFALLGARSTQNWLESDKRILVIESSRPDTNGCLKDFTINGINYFADNFVARGETGETTTNGSNQNLDRGSTGWLHVTAVLNFTAQTIDIKVTKIADSSVILQKSDLAFLDSNVPSLEYFFVNGGKQYGGTCLDNISVRSKADVIEISTTIEPVGDGATFEVKKDDTLTLKATTTAQNSGGTAIDTTYRWEIAEADKGFAEISDGAETDTVTIKGKNTTITDHPVNVTLTVTAGTATKDFPRSVIAKADASLLTPISFAGTNATSVEAGKDITLATTGGTADASLGAVVKKWKSSDETIAEVDDNGKVTGIKAATTPVTITVTATLGSLTQTASCPITVTESMADLTTITLKDIDGEKTTGGEVAKGGKKITFTATTNDRITVPTEDWTVTANPNTVKIDKEAKDDTCTVTVTSGNDVGIVTITVTAEKNGKQAAPETYTLTVREPKTKTYRQDFEAVTDIADVVQVNKDTVNPTIALGDDDTKYAKIDFNSANVREQTATIAIDLPESLDADYKVEFDLQLAGPNAQKASARQRAQFVLGADAIATNINPASPYTGGYLFALYNYATGTTATDADNTDTHPNGQQNNLWALSLDDTGTEITLDRTKKYHFVITVDADKNVTAVAYSGSDYALGSASAGAEIAATSTVFSNINMLLGRASGFYYIDNIVVSYYE